MAESSTTKPRTEVRVSPTIYDDLPGIAACELLAFSGAFPPFELFSRLLYPFRAPLAHSGAHPRHWPDYDSTVRERGRNLRDGFILFTAFAKDDEGHEMVVGWAKMTPPKEMLEMTRRGRKWKDRVLNDVVYPVVDSTRNKLWKDNDGADYRFLLVFKKEQQAVRDRIDMERQYFYLNILYVHPSYQNQGVGSALLAQCTSISDAAGIPLMLESTTAGLQFYGARGFVQVDTIDFTYDEERIVFPAMVRQPVAPPLPPKVDDNQGND